MARKTVGSPGSEHKPSEHSAAPVSSDSEFGALRAIVERAHAEGTTLDEAEKLAARFLAAQMQVAEELASLDLEARVKKNGLKAIKSAAYMAEATKGEKKPSEGFLENVVNLDKTVAVAQDTFDRADARKESLLLYMGIFKDAHIYFRGIAKGRFE